MQDVSYIYVLIDPRPNTNKMYIGKSYCPYVRYKQHITGYKSNPNTHNSRWINSMKSDNCLPELMIIDEVPVNEENFWERHYISLFKSWDIILTNGTIGGNGGATWNTKHTEETKKKISKSNAGKLSGKNNPMYGKKPWLGKHHSEETKAKIGIAHKGSKKPWSIENGKNNKGRVLTEQQRINIGNGVRGKMSGNRHPNYGKSMYPKAKEGLKNYRLRIKYKNRNCNEVHVINPTGCDILKNI